MAKINIGKSVFTSQDINFDFNKHMQENDKATNIIIAGNDRQLNTKIMFKMFNQFEDDDSVSIVLITNQLSVYEQSSIFRSNNIDVIKTNEEFNADAEIQGNAIKHIINQNYVNKKHTVFIIDFNGDGIDEPLYQMLLNFSILAKVHNCTMISTWSCLAEIPGNMIQSSNIYLLSHTNLADIKSNNRGRLRKIGLVNKRLQKLAWNLHDNTYILNVDGHRALITNKEN